MRTHVSSIVVIAVLFSIGSNVAHAQMMRGYGTNEGAYGMMGAYGNSEATSAAKASTDAQSSEAAGAALWKQLTSGATTCTSLTDNDFDALGDYFMGSMMGSGHEAMDQYMTNTLGESGDREMHIAMGKRISGCDPNAAYPAGSYNYVPMMMGGYGMMGGWGNTPMHWGGYGYGYGYGSWRDHELFMWFPGIFLLALIIVGVVVLMRVLRRGRRASSALDILKERYAKDELTKEEFEAKKKDINA